MTIGDILAVIAAILAIAITWGATILLAALGFPAKVALAQEMIAIAPGRTFLRGLLTSAGVAILAGIINTSHSGPTRVVAGALWVGLLILCAVGSAAVVRLVAERIESSGSQLTGFAALTRAAGLYVAAGFLPVVGWFAIAPVALIFSVGAASAAIFARSPKPRSDAPVAPDVQPVALPTTPGVPIMSAHSTKLARRQVLGLGALGLATVLIAGCGESLEQRFTKVALPDDPLPPASALEALPAMRILSRVAYGPRPGNIARVERMGHAAYIEEQLNPEKIAENAACAWRVGSLSDMLDTDTGLLFDEDDHRLVQALRQATTLRAVYSSRQLYERMAEFWSDHFNIYAFKGQGPQLKVVDDQATIRKYALGRFRDLLGSSARSAAMLGYLDNTVNRKGVPNENYAREIMELHTLGVHGGYTQHDVKEVARCFTGWTSDKNWHRGRFLFDSSAHDIGAKQVLGITLPAGGGIRDGEKVLDILAAHPATAHYLATKLCIRFLGDAPQETVSHVASAFLKTGGDIRATLRALLTPQALVAAPPILKRPYDYAVSALRALNADTDAGAGVQKHLESMGQSLFGWPMPNGYPEEARSWVGGLVPRWNFALSLAGGSIENTNIDLSALAKAGSKKGLSAGGSLIEFALGVPAASPSLSRLRAIANRCPGNSESAALILMSPEFQWR